MELEALGRFLERVGRGARRPRAARARDERRAVPTREAPEVPVARASEEEARRRLRPRARARARAGAAHRRRARRGRRPGASSTRGRSPGPPSRPRSGASAAARSCRASRSAAGRRSTARGAVSTPLVEKTTTKRAVRAQKLACPSESGNLLPSAELEDRRRAEIREREPAPSTPFSSRNCSRPPGDELLPVLAAADDHRGLLLLATPRRAPCARWPGCSGG